MAERVEEKDPAEMDPGRDPDWESAPGAESDRVDSQREGSEKQMFIRRLSFSVKWKWMTSPLEASLRPCSIRCC